jgi:hypothetical protein
MKTFSFDRALMFGFRAAHAKSFLWLYPLVYAVVWCVLIGGMAALGMLMAPDLMTQFQQIEAMENEDPAAVFAALGQIAMVLAPLLGLSTLLAWIVWAMFEAASQRRYVRDEKFSLGFGMDEMRIMWVSLLWTLMMLVLFLPVWIMLGYSLVQMLPAIDTTGPGELPPGFGLMMGSFGLMIPCFLLYTFFATRLAPSLALTIKDRKAKFVDAWNVSRGRFWPILGAFLIIYIVGSIVMQIVQTFGQMALMPAFLMIQSESIHSMGDFFSQPAVLAGLGIFLFITLAIQALYVHLLAGPAALAARTDPRNDADQATKVDTFS